MSMIYKSLHHPNMLTFIDIVREDSIVTIVTDLVNGANLEDTLFNPGRKVKSCINYVSVHDDNSIDLCRLTLPLLSRCLLLCR